MGDVREQAKNLVLAHIEIARATPTPPGRRALEAQARSEAAAKRAEIRRLERQLAPPPMKSQPFALTLDEELAAMRDAAAARKAGDTRPRNDLVREAADRVREARKPRER